MKRIGYYPGCSLHATAREFDESLRAVMGKLDVQLAEIDDWSCCGATSAHVTNHLLSIALPARNLALAESQGLEEVLAPCAACFNRLAAARHAVRGDEALGAKVRKVLARPFENRVTVRNVVDLLRGLSPAIQAKSTGALKGMKVACYYGCLLVRPAEICESDDPEQPVGMEAVARAAGAEPVAWDLKLECCGGGFSISRTASVLRLSRAIIEDARRAGAEAIVVACPMCHSNLDFRQDAMLASGERPMPVVFLSELVGLALGVPHRELGLQRHFVGTDPLVTKAALAAEAARAQAAAKAAVPAGAGKEVR